jgi:lysophospholipase L1-like esterase
MKRINENKVIKVMVPLFLVVSLLGVVALGEKKQAKASKQLWSILNETETNKKSDNMKIEEKEIVPEVLKRNYTYEGAKVLGVYNNTRWKNKKWYALGDNIKNVNGYTLKVKTLAGVNVAFSDAIDGRIMGDMSKNITAEKLKDIELITVFGGANDYSLDTPLGTINDDENMATFYGSLKRAINDILQVKANAAIVFITPLNQSANANKIGVKLDSYVQAINEVCKSYNILVFDLYSKSGINEKNIKNYTMNNLELNNQGIQKVSQVISDYIKTIK